MTTTLCGISSASWSNHAIPSWALSTAIGSPNAAAGRAPSRGDILPEEIRSILPNILILDIVGGVPRLKYRLVGTEFVHIYGAEITGKFVDEIDFDGMRELIVADYFKMVKDCRPSGSCWSFAKDDGRWLEYERVTLPLSQDGTTVNMLLAGVGGGGLAAY